MVQKTLALPGAIERAAAAYKKGHLEEAESLCRVILGVKADHFDATHLLAGTLTRRGRHLESLTHYDRAVALRPDLAEVLNNRGVALHHLERFDDALASCDRAIALRPDYADAHNNRGNSLRMLRRFKEALESYDQAIRLRPDFSTAFNCRGIALKEMRRYAESLASYDRALALQPDFSEAHNNRGNALRFLKRHEEALASFDHALKLRPNYSIAHNNRGIALKELKRHAEALESYERAIAFRPDYAEAFNNRANALQELNRNEEAMVSVEQALAIRPDYAEAYNNRGVLLKEMGRFDEVLASYDKSIVLRPDYAEAHLNRAIWKLLRGEFEPGWEDYEWRWESPQVEIGKRNYAQPLWVGQGDIVGKTMLLYAEQGFGDTIQFYRYARLVAECGAQVILQVQPQLKRLLSGIAGPRIVLAQGEPLPPFDLQCPLLSLPRAFGTRLATIPPADIGLRAPPELTQQWAARLGVKSKPRVGIVWSGRPTHLNDRNRSISLQSLLGLLQLPVQIVSLQKEVHGDDQNILLAQQSNIAHFGPEIGDFADTAALASLMDVVVSVDTSVAHLAATLGRPTWIMLPHSPDWRWMMQREDSPWYPSVRLFRQRRAGDVEDVVRRVTLELGMFFNREGGVRND